MDGKIPSTKDMCLTPGLEHKLEFKIAAHGTQTFQCANGCGLILDVIEDSQP